MPEISSNAKKFLSYKSISDGYEELITKSIVVEAFEFLRNTDLKNLPPFLNHPNPIVQHIIEERLSKG